jgi:hypothetical protein
MTGLLVCLLQVSCTVHLVQQLLLLLGWQSHMLAGNQPVTVMSVCLPVWAYMNAIL